MQFTPFIKYLSVWKIMLLPHEGFESIQNSTNPYLTREDSLCYINLNIYTGNIYIYYIYMCMYVYFNKSRVI